jgi:hypothetical protein
MLGIITDMSFNREGRKDKLAGKRLIDFVRTKDEDIPIIFTSSETANIKYVDLEKDVFIDKNSKTFPFGSQ